MRRRFMTVGILALLAGSATAASTPNVVVFYSDDMGNGDLACYGAKDVKTPNIDALAASGIRFTNYYAAAPICSPSRAAMLTGRYPARAGLSSKKNIASNMNAPGLPTREVTIAELAKKAGYATAVFGKWHLGSIHECQPNSQGFDLFVGHHASCLDSFSHMYYASEPWYYDLYRNREEIYEDGVHITDLITRETLRFIDDHRGERFLIYVAYNTPHYPMVARGKFVQMYAGLPKARQVWAASVTELDDSVGQIMSRLRERDLLKDTLVFFASDNGAPNESLRGEGGGSNAPYREYKRSLFEGGIRVPGMVSGQGLVPAGVVCDQPVIGMDFFSTIAEAIHAEVPKDRTIDGASWYPLFKDPTQSVHDALFFEWDDQHAVRSGDWKLVENGLLGMAVSRTNRATGDDAVFLSSIKVDSGEQHNVRHEHADVAERLVRLHEAWRREIAQDPTASPDALATSKPEPARGGRFDRE